MRRDCLYFPNQIPNAAHAHYIIIIGLVSIRVRLEIIDRAAAPTNIVISLHVQSVSVNAANEHTATREEHENKIKMYTHFEWMSQDSVIQQE